MFFGIAVVFWFFLLIGQVGLWFWVMSQSASLDSIVSLSLLIAGSVGFVTYTGILAIAAEILGLRQSFEKWQKAGGNRISTSQKDTSKTAIVVVDTGDTVTVGGNTFHRLSGEDGTAFCIGCRKVAQKNTLLYCPETDTYYHRSCLPVG